MLGERSKILFDSIKRLLRRQATSHLRNIVNKTHAADLSIVFRSLPIYDQYKLFEMIDDIEKLAQSSNAIFLIIFWLFFTCVRNLLREIWGEWRVNAIKPHK